MGDETMTEAEVKPFNWPKYYEMCEKLHACKICYDWDDTWNYDCFCPDCQAIMDSYDGVL